MPTLETPPNPAGAQPPTEREPQPIKLSAGRFGELDHTELVHLLDSYDDERARATFRESIYIAVIVWLALAWLVLYGPRVLFHQGRIVPVAADRRNNELSYLEMPKSLEKIPPKPAKVISDQNNRAQTAHPVPKPLTPQELQAMRKAGSPGASNPAPRPAPPTPQPQQALPPAPQPQPQQQQPRPQPTQQASNVPDAPRPSQATKPNFSTPSNPGDSIRQAADAAANQRGQGGENGESAPKRGHPGANTGVEVLSDTLGVDFGPYIKRLLRETQGAWEPLIPEECYPPIGKTGWTQIRFIIQPNGVVSAMHLDGSTHDIAIDKAAWGSITSQGQMHPLPATFKGPNLELRIQFNIIRDGSSAR